MEMHEGQLHVAADTARELVHAQAARELLGGSRVPTPEPVAIGEPGAGYPLPWASGRCAGSASSASSTYPGHVPAGTLPA